MKDLIIFADYGLDDAAATVTVFKNREKFGEITIVPIGGNVPTEMSFNNCLTLLNKLEWQPDAVVDTRDIPQPTEYLPKIHGGDGMGDIFEENHSFDGMAIKDFKRFVSNMKGDEIILSLGPATLVAEVLREHPGCQLVLMGGCIEEEPNFKGYEFNQALNVEAFEFCVSHKHVAITLDTCRRGGLNIRGVEIEGNDTYSQILRADQNLSISRGEDGCFVWDDVAACYLIHPERFSLNQKNDRWGNVITEACYVSDLKYFE